MNIAMRSSCYPLALPTVAEALAIVSSRFAPICETELVALQEAAGRVLAEDVLAAIAMPPWDRSAMDGFAFRGGAGAFLRRIGHASAAQPFVGAVAEGDCVGISTGARLPQGCDTVVPRERCVEKNGSVEISAGVPFGANVRRRGEDFRPGTILAPSGTRLDVRHIALLASAGIRELSAIRKLRVGILSIGDELRTAPGQQLFDANRPMLMAACRTARTSDLGVLPDHRPSIAAMLAGAAQAHDIIISSGGTSEGDEDHVRGALRDCGGDLLVAGVAIKPGKPVTFGRIGKCLHIALPGNPVAALATFLALGVPLMNWLAGQGEVAAVAHPVRVMFTHPKKKGLREYVRVRLQPGPDGMPQAWPGVGNGAAQLLSLAQSDGFVCLDESMAGALPGMTLPFQSFAELLA